MITAEGFIRPTFDEILAEVQANAISKFDDGGTNNPNVEPEAWLGVMTALIAKAKDDLYKVAEDTYFSLFISTATGVSLDRVANPTLRIAAQAAVAPIDVLGTPATVIPLGFEFERDDGLRYATTAEITIGGGGSASGFVQAVTPGLDGNAPVGAIKFIPVPLVGLDSVTNPAPAQGGEPIETDSELRERAIADRSTDLTSSLQAIENRVRKVEGVLSVRGFENTDKAPVDGRPGVSFEIVVRGGTDADVAAAIFAAKPAGVESFGDITEVVIDPTNNQSFDVSFSRVTDISISYQVNLTTNAEYNSSVARPLVVQALIDYTGGVNTGGVESPGLMIGEDVLQWKAEASLFNPNGDFLIVGVDAVTIFLEPTSDGMPITGTFVDIADKEEAFTAEGTISFLEV